MSEQLKQPFPTSENRLDGETKASTTKLSEDLQSVLNRTDIKDISFEQILNAIHQRGSPALLFILALPFVFSPLPGLSTPIGIIIALFGLRMMLDKHLLLPQWLLKKTIPRSTYERIVQKVVPWIKRIEKLLHPRIRFLHSWPMFRMANSIAISSNGILLALPLPFPFTNNIPALATVLLSLGMMEEDGLFILSGYFVTICAWIYILLCLSAILWAGKLGLHTFLR